MRLQRAGFFPRIAFLFVISNPLFRGLELARIQEDIRKTDESCTIAAAGDIACELQDNSCPGFSAA
jgi:hypothetical protein